MPYQCHCCDFQTEDKKEFNAHLDTPEHQEGEYNYCPEVIKDRITLLEERVSALESKM